MNCWAVQYNAANFMDSCYIYYFSSSYILTNFRMKTFVKSDFLKPYYKTFQQCSVGAYDVRKAGLRCSQ